MKKITVLKQCLGRGWLFALESTVTVHEQAQSNRACSIFNFAVLGFTSAGVSKFKSLLFQV
jgi:hypothetical protein